jgi:hypothetical protein
MTFVPIHAILDDITVLDTLHINRSLNLHKYWDGDGSFMVLDTKELGRVLYTHCNRYGCTRLTIPQILYLWDKYDCRHFVTCYPRMVEKYYPQVMKEMGLLYSDHNVPIGMRFQEEHVMINFVDN